MSAWQGALAALPAGARVVLRCAGGPASADALGTAMDLGLVCVPLAPRSTDRELASVADRSGASLLLDGPGLTPRPLPGDPAHPEADGLALLLFTSGSTGQPKGVKLGRDAVLGNALKTAELHRFSPDRPHGTCLPLHHCNAIVLSLIGTRATGTPLILSHPFDPHRYLKELDTHRARTASIAPALLHELVEARPPWPETLDYLVTASAPLTSDLARRFHRHYGPRLRQGYGLTEAVNFSFTMPRLDEADFRDQYLDRRPPVGLPLPGTELHLEDGEVWIRTPDRMRGYWDDPQATARVLTDDGWLRTGDLGELRDGFLVLSGRADERVNRGGEKYHPVDIEQRWRERGLTGKAAAVAVQEPVYGQDFGLVAPGASAERLRAVYEGGFPRPLAVATGGYLATGTGKPQRTAMGRGLAALRDSPQRYDDLLRYAAGAARAMLASGVRPATAQAACLYRQSLALAQAAPGDTTGHGTGTATSGSAPRTAAHDALDALVEAWPQLAAGALAGDEVMQRHRGLWKRLMCEWPMGRYAELVERVLDAGGLLSGRVLEVGSGVGNTTARIAERVGGEFVWSDRVPQLVARGGWPGRGIVLDLDHEPPSGLGGFDTVVATNVVHCVADKPAALRNLYGLLRPGGRLVLAEGTSPTAPDGTPWALDPLFCLFDGWWDRGGFRSRWEWLALFEAAGLRDLGFSALRAGPHDLGGVVWGSRPSG
ncbi:AMP-binding protein [Streptomyces sp. RB6PN25]|uniref:AMP-binding protein n=1 Tax=Streptomyces humicola TaxID=2953240 RepID=A0ABT1PPL6_9ACTN|nr:AMP-binding protein [Streptomyces humicola]MCQ4079621.1 AMP-binding protein [Streptomyces humicola]